MRFEFTRMIKLHTPHTLHGLLPPPWWCYLLGMRSPIKRYLQPSAEVSWYWLVVIAAARLVMIVSNGLFTKWTVEVFTKKMSLWEGFHVSVLTAVGNFFGPLFGGLGIRAVYLKKIHNLAYSKFTATLIGYYLVMFSLNSLLAIIGLVLLPQTGQTTLLF